MQGTTPALVIGGGVAGAAVAAQLAQAGRPVVLIERREGPHDKVCGEFLSGEAALHLEDLNIDLRSLGAVRIEAVRIFANDHVATARLPFPAFGLSRRVLDDALLRAATFLGAVVRRGSSVRSLQQQDRGWMVELDDGSRISATDVFLATGKHDLRGWKRPPGVQADLIAFKLHWRLKADETAALGAGVELSFFPGGYAGLQPVENGVANLCLVVRRQTFLAVGQTWESLLSALRSACPHLDQRLAGADPCDKRPLAIAHIPYGYVEPIARGPWLLGDQAAVIPSFSGEGIAIALHSTRLAAQIYAAGGSAFQFQSRLARDVAGQVWRATLMSQMLVRRTGQAIAAAGARVIPDLLRAIARHTRIPARRVESVRSNSLGAAQPTGRPLSAPPSIATGPQTRA
jgi:flavin-dependent dehydrogenase